MSIVKFIVSRNHRVNFFNHYELFVSFEESFVIIECHQLGNASELHSPSRSTAIQLDLLDNRCVKDDVIQYIDN